MGLTTWKNAPAGKILKPDAAVAKNYLTEVELKSLDRFVTMYFDYAEDRASRNIPMTMRADRYPQLPKRVAPIIMSWNLV